MILQLWDTSQMTLCDNNWTQKKLKKKKTQKPPLKQIAHSQYNLLQTFKQHAFQSILALLF